jgi:hypothetical protein
MELDRSGKFKKYSYMSIHFPDKAARILEWSKKK